MLFPKVKKYGTDNGFKTNGVSVFKEIKNCFFVLKDGSNMKLLTVYLPACESDDEAFLNGLNSKKGAGKVVITGSMVDFVFNERLVPLNMNRVDYVIKEVTHYFSGKYFGQNVACSCCHEASAEDVISLGSDVQFICGLCKTDIEKSYSELPQIPVYKYLTAVICSLLACIPVIALTIVVFCLADRIMAFSSILYLLAISFIYKKIIGRISCSGCIYITFFSLIMTVLGLGFSYIFSVMYMSHNEYPDMMPMNIDGFLYVMIIVKNNPELLQELLENIIGGFIISIIAVSFQIRAIFLKKDNNTIVPIKDME